MREHRRPGTPSGGLDRAGIVRAALHLVDRDGAESLSMRGLGKFLGVDPMAVYHYVPNKNDLFDAMVLAVYDEIDAASLPWEQGGAVLLATFARRFRACLRNHPGMVAAVATRPVQSPAQLAMAERAIALLTEEGHTSRWALTLTRCIQAFTIGQVLAEVAEPVGGPSATATDVRAQIASNELPAMTAAVAAGYRPEEQFEAGLRALLDGFAEQRCNEG